MISPTTASHARGILRALRVRSGQVEASAWVSLDGFVLASDLDDRVNADRIGAMCASLFALSGRAAQEVNVGRLRQIILEGSEGIMMLIQAGGISSLALSAPSSANLGRIILEARAAALELAQLEAEVQVP